MEYRGTEPATPRRMTVAALERLGLADLDVCDADDLWAVLEERGWRVLNGGSQAVVAILPDDPGHVLRISIEEDGWVSYAAALQGEEFVPLVAALGWHDHLWFAIVERLEPLPDEMSLIANALAREAARAGRAAPDLPSPDPAFEALERRWPGLLRFTQENLAFANDITPSNLMMRGETLVVNDPVDIMSIELLRELRAEWGMAPEVTPDDEMACAFS